ncbi:MAG: hypothetical protein R3272_14010 [Candidatus Promineifilaceae bacterium]|nr:hypothetical protein [Candidatus Promineifilaceae bacterium]
MMFLPKSLFNAFLALLVVMLVACMETGPAPCDEGGTLFSDDFEGEQECGWAQYQRGGAVAEIAEGELYITTSQPGQIWWTTPGRTISDVIISGRVRHVEGPINNAYGLICRYQSPDNFYVFLISSDGYYAIGKYQVGNDQIIYLNEEEQYVFSEAINQGEGSTNLIRATCSGNELSLTVNGSPLATVVDPTFVTGDFGVAASTFEAGALEIAFDDVQVIAP